MASHHHSSMSSPSSARTPKGSSQRGRKPQLPKLGNVNKRAQHIISANMHSSSVADSLASSTMTVPVLMQIDSTAPHTAKTHDISHRCDQGTFLRPRIPESLIPESDHVFDKTFMPKDATSIYSDDDGLWHTKVFPSQSPSSRQDAVLLDAWISKALENHAAEAQAIARESVSKAVDELVPLLSVALHEMVRQVTHQCTERGVVLDKVWQTYVTLFDRVLRQMQESLYEQKEHTKQVQEVLHAARKDLSKLKKEHPEQMHKIIADLEEQFTTRQQEFEEDLQLAEADNSALKDELRAHHRELELWYPHFQLYQDSYVKNHVPQQSTSRRARKGTMKAEGAGDSPREASEQEEVAPEVAVAEDFKRLLAVLAPEKRKMIGREIAPVMDSKYTKNMDLMDRTESKRMQSRLSLMAHEEQAQRQTIETVDRLQKEVQEQELYIKKLRAEIAAVESKLKAKNENASDALPAADAEETPAAASAPDAANASEAAAPNAKAADGELQA